jgi:hypothetical protein
MLLFVLKTKIQDFVQTKNYYSLNMHISCFKVHDSANSKDLSDIE